MQELNTQAMRQSTREKLDRLRGLFEDESHQYTRISDWYDSLRKRGERFGNAQLSAWLGTNSYYTQSEYTRLAVTHAVHPSQIDKPIPVVPVQESLTVKDVAPSNFGSYAMKQESLPMEARAVAYSEDDPVDPRVVMMIESSVSSEVSLAQDCLKEILRSRIDRKIAEALDANRVVIESMLDAKINSAIAFGLSAQNHYIDSKIGSKISEAREPLVLRATMDVLQSVESVINDKIAEVIEYTTKQLNSRTDLVYKDMHTSEDRCIERIQDAINNIDDEKEGSAWDKIAKMVSSKISMALSVHSDIMDKTIAERIEEAQDYTFEKLCDEVTKRAQKAIQSSVTKWVMAVIDDQTYEVQLRATKKDGES